MNRKKVLIVSYSWPPCGGINVLRILKIVKYIRSFGWEPILYIPENADYPYLDENNFKDIPEDLTILKRPIIEPFGLFKKVTGRKKDEPLNNVIHVREKKRMMDNLGIFVRGNFFIPDARSLWVRPSVKYLTQYLKDNPVDAIFSDGPPHTNTLIACKVGKNTGTPVLTDYQDPWTQVDYYAEFNMSAVADYIHKKQEKFCFDNADKICISSPATKIDLESIGAKNVEVLPYGFDEADFEGMSANKNEKEFIISHAGLFGRDRYSENFFKALKKLVEENKTGKRIILKLAGQIDYMITEAIEKFGLKNNFEFLGTIPRVDSIQLMFDTDVLLLPLNQTGNTHGRIPGKFYENMRTYNQILALGPDDSDVGNMLNETNCGKCCAYEDFDSIYNFLNQALNKGIQTQVNKKAINNYSNYNLTKKVAGWLDEISK
jgi:hypothetical protein